MAVANLEITGQYSSQVIAALEDADFRAAYLAEDADFLPFIRNPGMATGFMSPFTLGAINHYRVEHDAEQARKAHFKNAPSRLTGVFAFESLAVCEEVSRKWGWDFGTVERFKPQHVLKQTRVNMEIISLARFAYSRASLDSETLEQLWRAYWEGVDGFSFELPSVDLKTREVHTVGATWEWIIDGALIHEDHVDSSSIA